jgi:hypothetical protein
MPKYFDSVADIPELSGKVIIVTGGEDSLSSRTMPGL